MYTKVVEFTYMFVYLFYQDVDITIRIMNSPFTLTEYYIHACV